MGDEVVVEFFGYLLLLLAFMMFLMLVTRLFWFDGWAMKVVGFLAVLVAILFCNLFKSC